MRLHLRPADLDALHAAGGALLDVDAPAAATADRLVAHLGPAFGVESAWGVEQGARAGAGAVVPTPFADAGSADIAEALHRLADLMPADVRLRERAAADAAVRLMAGTPRLAWHLEEFPRLLGAPAYHALRQTALFAALSAPGRGATASGFVSAGPGMSASLILSRRARERGARRARARATFGLLAPGVHARHALRAQLAARHLTAAAAAGSAADVLDAPALLLAPDGREAHRNAALVALLGRPGVHAPEVLAALHAGGRAALALARAAAPGDGRSRRGVGDLGRSAGPADAPPPGVHAAAVPWGGAGHGVLVVLAAPPDPGTPAPAAPAVPAADAEAEAARGLHGLTPREYEVARLLAERRTNAEVAAALDVSVHTVRRHVERVLAKLRVRSRLDVRARLAGAGRAERPAVRA